MKCFFLFSELTPSSKWRNSDSFNILFKASVDNSKLYLAIFQMCPHNVRGSKYFKTKTQILRMHLLPIILIEIPDDHAVSENRETVLKNHTLLNFNYFNSLLRIWCTRITLGKNTGICTTGKPESVPRKHLSFIKWRVWFTYCDLPIVLNPSE